MNTLQGAQDLLAKAYQGDKSSELKLFEKINARIANLLRYRLVKGREAHRELEEDVKDIVQDIMIEIVKQFREKRLPLDYLPQWLYTITNRRTMDYFRKKYKQPTSLENIPIPLMDSEQVQEVFESKELHNIVSRALARLGNKCKEIIQALLNEKKNEYIKKQAQQKKMNTIYSDIHRCRQNFVDMLKLEGYDS